MRPLTWILAFAAFLALLAVLLIVVGGHDAALSHASFGIVASGALMLATGALLAVAAFQLVDLSRRGSWPDGIRPPCKLSVIVAFLVVILLAVYVFFSALNSRSGQRPVVVAVALLLVVIGLLGLYVFGRDARVTLPRLGAIALGLVGTMIGAWEFWYQNQYVPSHAGRAVALKVALSPLASTNATQVVRASVSYTDAGGSVAVVGSTYTLTGSRVVRCERRPTTAKVQRLFRGFATDPIRRYTTDVFEEPAEVLAAGKFIGDGRRLDPNVEASKSFIFFVPRRKYQLLRFEAQLFAIPASVPISQRHRPHTRPLRKHGNDIYVFWHVDDDSWLHDLVYGRDRWVVVRYELVDPSSKAANGNSETTLTTQQLRVTARFPAATWSSGEPSRSRVEHLFSEAAPSDASEPFADTELALERVAKPTQADVKKVPECETVG